MEDRGLEKMREGKGGKETRKKESSNNGKRPWEDADDKDRRVSGQRWREIEGEGQQLRVNGVWC